MTFGVQSLKSIDQSTSALLSGHPPPSSVGHSPFVFSQVQLINSWSMVDSHWSSTCAGKISMAALFFFPTIDVIGCFCLSSARTSYHHQYCLSNCMLAPSSLSDQILLPHGHPPPLSGFAHQSIVSPSGRCLHPYSCTSCSCSSCIKGQPPTHPPKQLLFSHCIIFTFSHG